MHVYVDQLYFCKGPVSSNLTKACIGAITMISTISCGNLFLHHCNVFHFLNGCSQYIYKNPDDPQYSSKRLQN